MKPLAGQDAQLLSLDFFRGKEEDVKHLTGVGPDLLQWFLKLLQAQVGLLFSRVLSFCCRAAFRLALEENTFCHLDRTNVSFRTMP